LLLRSLVQVAHRRRFNPASLARQTDFFTLDECVATRFPELGRGLFLLSPFPSALFSFGRAARAARAGPRANLNNSRHASRAKERARDKSFITERRVRTLCASRIDYDANPFARLAASKPLRGLGEFSKGEFARNARSSRWTYFPMPVRIEPITRRRILRGDTVGNFTRSSGYIEYFINDRRSLNSEGTRRNLAPCLVSPSLSLTHVPKGLVRIRAARFLP